MKLRLLFLCGLIVAVRWSAGEPPAARTIERYKQMLVANPIEGTAMERLWKAYADAGTTAQLIADYQADASFASRMILGHLLRRAGQPDGAVAAFRKAAELDPKSVLPLLAVAALQDELGQPRQAAESLDKAVAILPAEDPKHGETLMQLGSAWLAAGELEKAAEAWERTIALDPANLGLRRRLAETYRQHHLADRAMVHLEYLASHASPAERALALQELARIHEGAGRADDAIAALDKGLGLTAPGNWLRTELLSQLIRLYQRQHRTPQLEARWKQRVAENPRDATGFLQLIELFERVGDLEQERVWLEKLVGLLPKNSDYRLRLARLYVRLDLVDAAGTLYDHLLEEQPAHPDLVFERASLDVQRGRADAARQRITALLAVKKNDENLRGRALEFFEANRMHAAVEEHLATDAANGAEEPLLALAAFYFTQRREAEAQSTLRRLVRKEAPKEVQAAAYARIAQALKSQGDIADAVGAIKSAIALDPGMRENYLLLGDLETARGDPGAARPAFEKAFTLSTTPGEALDADQKIFDSVRSQTPRQDSRPIDPRALPALARSEDGQSISTPALQDVLLTLTRAAAANPTVDRWLRIARWQLWSRNPRVAQECAQQALTLDGRSVAAHEFLVKLATVDPQPPRAIGHLRELMEIDPAGRAGYQRRIAQIELQSGRSDEALQIFRELSATNPGNLDALNDLALAQQRAERWADALVTCRQIHALSPASRKKEAAGQLLRIYDRLQMPGEASALLLAQIDAQTDDKERFNLFQELLTRCSKRGQLDWLREQFEERRKLRADDYFTSMALGRVLKAAGEKSAAFDLIADASLAAPNPVEALPELVREAEDLRKLATAVHLQEQLIKIVPQSRADAYEKLAQLQERSFDIEAAARSWAKITAKFPRDATVLQHAVDFELKWGVPSRALELLRKARELEPANLRTLATLAELELESGTTAEAEKCFEEILRFAPRDNGEAIHFPAWKPEDPARLQTSYLDTVRLRRGRPNSEAMRALRSFWVADQPGIKSESDVRLNAIKQLARLAQIKGDAGALERWIKRWQKASESPSETLWALYYAGAHEALLDHLETLMARPESEAQVKQAFLWLALQTREFERLSRWLRNARRTASDRDFLLVALGQYLQANGGRIDPALIERLFPPGFRLRLWQAAQMFGNRGQFREAAQLGQRVFDGLTMQRAGFGLDLATWYLYLGDIEAARRVLRASIDSSGENFDAPVYAALRQYWLLLPASERRAFADTFLGGLDERTQPLHAAICGAVLHGLAGDELQAQEQLRHVLASGAMANLSPDEAGNSAARVWEFILNAGAQLQSWKLDRLAIFFWKNALSDPALIRLQTQAQSEEVQTRSFEARTRLCALMIARADAFERDELIADYARHSLHDGLIPLGEALETIGAYARSIEICRQLWEREPENPHALRNLISACRTGGDLETLEQVLRRCLREGIFRSNDGAQRDLALQLVELLENRGAIVEARQILAGMLDGASTDSRLLLRLAQLHERSKQSDQAEAVYRRILSFEPGNIATRLALAALLKTRGESSGAVALLEQSTGVEVETMLAQLYLERGQRDEALSALERLPPGSHIAATLASAEILISRGESREALVVLRNGASRSPDPRANFPLQSRIIELLPANEDRGVVAREWRRLRRIAGDDRNMLSAYFELLLREARRLHWEKETRRELAEDWDEGEGLLPAGAALVEWELGRKELASAEIVSTRLLARSDLTEPIAQKIVSVAVASDRVDLLIKARGRLARLNPLDYSKTIEWAQALANHDRKPEAMRVVQDLTWRAALNEEIATRLAELLVSWGESARAKEFFQLALAGDPAARNYRAYLGLARLQLAEKNYAEAKKLLRVAFRNPANRECGELITYLAAAGRLVNADRELGEFELDPVRMIEAQRALFAHWKKQGVINAALLVLEGHPDMIDAPLLAQLRELVKPAGLFQRAAELLEHFRLERAPSGIEFDRELALLYGDWAEADLLGLQTEPALQHLRRSQELVPDQFAVARRLSELYSQRGEVKHAQEALERFLTAATEPTEKEAARQLLGRIR